MITNAFNYEGKSEYDMLYHEVRLFIDSKLDARSRQDILFDSQISDQNQFLEKIVVELSLASRESSAV